MAKTPSLVKKLEAILGKDHVIYHPDDLLVFEYDGSIDKALPEAVVFPSNVDEVSSIVKLAYENEIPIVSRGSGTGLSGGAIVSLGGIQIVLTRMNRILEVDVENKLAVVEPGVINLDLDEHARGFGLRYAPDPSSQRACSIGGNVAENAGGPHCLAYGVTSNHILGLEIVLEDGSVTWLGSRSRETVGYDLRGAFVGSEGTFGITTRIIVRLLDVPIFVKTYLGVFPHVDDSCNAVSAVIAKGIVPAALEIIDSLSIKAVQNVTDAGLPDSAGAVLLVEVEGSETEVEELGADVAGVLKSSGATEVKSAETNVERDRLWAARKGALGALGSLAPNYYLVDGVVPRTRLTEVLQRVAQISVDYDMPIANVFHAGDGNLHPCILFDDRGAGELERVKEVGGAILKACVELGGALTGEHGVGLEKKEYMPLVYSENDLDAMRKLQSSFGSRGLFNPGKVFPGGPQYDHSLQKGAVAAVGPGAHV